ncbi:Dfp1/Him1, central region-domain-containing protein [Dichomitus squalens]|uniref:Dfp1/Him1, central region-domain-containing protein n=1 Tax=Dichomitus squalens TaxID=114155 RepID=A0A4Q9MP81_9APHY|nr:Dfp1/Him1, central region-domain-containing protein [Dichomitus squalens]
MSISPCRTTLKRANVVLKRPHSPEPADTPTDHSSKRVKTTPSAPVVQESPTPAAAARAEAKKEKERRREKERIQREEEFKAKYSRAFPSWVFYFDLDSGNPETALIRNHLEKRVSYMGARIDDFFSKEITHFITLHDVDDKENKEKETVRAGAASAAAAAAGGGLLASPIKLRGRALTAGTKAESLVQKAQSFNMKIWSATKLHNVLDRCEAPRVSASGALPTAAQRSSKDHNLAQLLRTERLHGTSERDPSQRRHDFTYFSKDSYFVLVEDIKQELATVAAAEYPIQRTRDGKEKGAWPVLHCHPHARGPFLEYDEREERRRQKQEKAEHDRREERARRKARLLQHERKRRAQEVRMQQHELRRTASMNNLHRRAAYPDASVEALVDLDADFQEESHAEQVHASGYLASAAYMAASGNSVNITSNTGTSTAGGLLRSLTLPPALKDKLAQQITINRRVSAAAVPTDRDNKENVMGPPTTIPDRVKFLRKSKSTNTLKLPKRDEVSKPGYCECCRQKFEDFREHIVGRRHRKFAADDNNFKALDAVLSRVRRRTVDEVAEENERWLAEVTGGINTNDDDDDELLLASRQDEASDDDVHWDEWMTMDGAKVEADA